MAEAAEQVGLGESLLHDRRDELPFDASRAFHAALVDGRVCLKGSVEALAPRCDRVKTAAGEHELDDVGREETLQKAQRLAERGLRVLMVAGGSRGNSVGQSSEPNCFGIRRIE